MDMDIHGVKTSINAGRHPLNTRRGEPAIPLPTFLDVPLSRKLFIFYLGQECVRCDNQLRLLAEFAERFAAAGYEVIAVYPAGKMPSEAPFRQHADDGTLAAAWSVPAGYHGIFLIDPDGACRFGGATIVPFARPEVLLSRMV